VGEEKELAMECPICGRSDVVEDTTVWCNNCSEWVDTEYYHEALEYKIKALTEQVQELQEQIRLRDEWAQQRIAIKESRPPLSVGKPCPKCGQTVR
jgi:hypothetical protein